MAAATWPLSLPQGALLAGLTETPPKTALRTEMDQGPAKTRRRFNSGVRKFTIPITMTDDQVETFDVFYNVTLAGGSLSFNYKHPRLKTTVELKIADVGDYVQQTGGAWRLTLQMEQNP